MFSPDFYDFPFIPELIAKIEKRKAAGELPPSDEEDDD